MGFMAATCGYITGGDPSSPSTCGRPAVAAWCYDSDGGPSAPVWIAVCEQHRHELDNGGDT